MGAEWAAGIGHSVQRGQCALPTAPGCPLVTVAAQAQDIAHLPLNSFCRFSVSKRIFVVGFGLYGSIHGPTDYQVNIQVGCQPLPCRCLAMPPACLLGTPTHSLVLSCLLHTMQRQPQLDLRCTLVPHVSHEALSLCRTTPISLRACPSAQAMPSSAPVVPACPAQTLATEQPLSPDHPYRQQHGPWPE